MGRLFVSARLSGSHVTVPTGIEMAADAITPLTPVHAAEVLLATHQAGIDEYNATFETAAPTWEAFDARSSRSTGSSHRTGRRPGAGLIGLAVHRRAGFRVIGTRERIGRHRGVWRNVLLIERLSPRIR